MSATRTSPRVCAYSLPLLCRPLSARGEGEGEVRFYTKEQSR
jgi:hypothetical protein